MHKAICGPAALLVLLLMGCGTRSAADTAASSARPQPQGCQGGGFLRASLRGAINADLDWHDSDISCDGSMRPDGHGLRLTVSGPLNHQGTTCRLRFVFGIDSVAADGTQHGLPTNLTAIVEDGQAIFATLGDDKCTTDSLRRTAPDPQQPQYWRVEASGFCVGPAATLDGSNRLLVSRFDFASTYTTEEHP
jgi:hypothetical protein